MVVVLGSNSCSQGSAASRVHTITRFLRGETNTTHTSPQLREQSWFGNEALSVSRPVKFSKILEVIFRFYKWLFKIFTFLVEVENAFEIHISVIV